MWTQSAACSVKVVRLRWSMAGSGNSHRACGGCKPPDEPVGVRRNAPARMQRHAVNVSSER